MWKIIWLNRKNENVSMNLNENLSRKQSHFNWMKTWHFFSLRKRFVRLLTMSIWWIVKIFDNQKEILAVNSGKGVRMKDDQCLYLHLI
jgi:hypothetical protein